MAFRAKYRERSGMFSIGRLSFWRGIRLEPASHRAFRDELEQAAVDRLRGFCWLLLVIHVALLGHDFAAQPAVPGSPEASWRSGLTVLHAAMLAACGLTLLGLRWFRTRMAKARAAYLMTVFLLVWGGVLSGVDQLIGASITIFLMVNLGAALFVTFESVASVMAFMAGSVAFLGAQIAFAQTPALAFSHGVNGVGFSLTCLFFSRMLYGVRIRDFSQRETISRQHADLCATNERLEAAHAKADQLLRAMLPARIVERLQRGEVRIADSHSKLVILWADLCGFTELASRLTASELVDLLDELFSEFDAIVHACGLEKIKTVGDGYLAVAGIPEPKLADVSAAAKAALALHGVAASVGARRGHPLSLRAGIAHGAAMAGVLGRERQLYDIWGDAVNVACRLVASARPGETLLTADVAESLEDSHEVGPETWVELKGKGPVAVRSLIAYSSASRLVVPRTLGLP